MSDASPRPSRALTLARQQWERGDWEGLLAWDQPELAQHPDRGELLLLCGAAQFQLGHQPQARTLSKRAQKWGATHSQFSRYFFSASSPHSSAKLHYRLPPNYQPAGPPYQLIVMGMHRSGTSMLAGLLHKLGAYFGSSEVAMPASEENPKGYFERLDLYQLTEYVLQMLQASWHSVAEINLSSLNAEHSTEIKTALGQIMGELNQHPVSVLKDPRLSVLFPLFETAFSNPIILHAYRNPMEVAQSLKVRNDFAEPYSLALWETHHRRAFAATQHLPGILVPYHYLVSSPQKATSQLWQILHQRMGVPLKYPEQDRISGWIDQSLHRNHFVKELKMPLTGAQYELWNQMERGLFLKEWTLQASLRA